MPQETENDLFEASSLCLCPIWKGYAGESYQVRQVVRCANTGNFVAFFCQYTVPNQQHRRDVTVELAEAHHLTPVQTLTATLWLKEMTQQYPPTKQKHPS